MRFEQALDVILGDVRDALSELVEEDADHFITHLDAADRIFASGFGRSARVSEMFAIRLMQLDYEVYVAGEAVTPAIREDDMLVTTSGSGETTHALSNMETAREAGASNYLITAHPRSSMGEIADYFIRIPGASKTDGDVPEEGQFLGCRFEQSAFLFCESIVHMIGDREDRDPDDILELHANLE